MEYRRGKSLRSYVDLCEEHLPDRATQKNIKSYLNDALPGVYFTKNDIEDIRTQLALRRSEKIEKVIQKFLRKFVVGYDKYDVEKYFSEAGFKLTAKELRAILERDKKYHQTVRLGAKEMDFITSMARITGLTKSMSIRSLILIGMGHILSGARIDLNEKIATAAASSQSQIDFTLTRASNPLKIALSLNKLRDYKHQLTIHGNGESQNSQALLA